MKAEEPHAFAPGRKLGPYVVQSLFAVGGMGEVYRAHDSRLGRDVAIKVLPRAFTADSERLARFEREARVLASLNHPNIATIYGFEESSGVQAIVLEFVDGPTLADRIAHGPISVEETFSVARQICDALEAAHEQGIIHRDLKPANIKRRPDGTVKVLDFGLAKALEPAVAVGADVTSPAVITHATTGVGVILGTAAYMSPEQAKGRTAGKRTDIWSFGCVLFEMLAGKRAFQGEDASDTLAAVLRGEPDWTALGDDIPAPIRRLLRRCLEKDPRRRLADISDVRIEIEEALGVASATISPLISVVTKRRWVYALASVVVALIATTGIATWLLVRALHQTPSVERLAIPLGASQQLAAGLSPVLAPAPDGTRLVYVAARPGSRTQLFLRQLDQFDAAAIAGTEGASAPFFSPDGEWVGFFAGDALQKVAMEGGAPLKICDVPSMVSASWGHDGTIVFSTAFSGDGLWRVAANGGDPEQLTKPDVAKGELHHAYPQMLPRGKLVLFTVVTADASYPAVFSTDTQQWHTLSQVRMAFGGVQYVPTGHLLYAQIGGLVAIPFNIDRGEPTGAPFPLRERVELSAMAGAQFSVSPAGTGALIYVPGRTSPLAGTLELVDRGGRASPLTEIRAAYSHPRFSPDGHQLAVTVDAEGGSDVWVYDLQRGTRTRLTAGGVSDFPTWAPDSRLVTFHAARPGPWNLYARPADGSAKIEPLMRTPQPPRPASGALNVDKLLPGNLPALSGANPQYPMSWTTDGRTLAFTERKPSGERDIWVLTSGSDPVPFLVSPFDESSPAFSPDGRFLAYVSDETGRSEVYVQPFPGPGGRWLISTAGGDDPVWSANGRELFYRRGGALMAVLVRTAPLFEVGAQSRLFESHDEAPSEARNYDVSPDGGHFVMVQTEDAPSAQQFHVVLNWFSEFGRRGASAR
jgi:Tol biopolymer transport system component